MNNKTNAPEKSGETANHELPITIRDLIKFPLKFDDYGKHFVFDADGHIFCEVRGWGKLQYEDLPDNTRQYNPELGVKKLGLIGEWITQTLNNSIAESELRAENERLREAINETIERCAEIADIVIYQGDWNLDEPTVADEIRALKEK